MKAETRQYKGFTIDINYDTNPTSPREDDNICVFHIAMRNNDFGDENYNNREDIDRAEKEALADGDICLPLYAYQHGGITISLNEFSCRWDSGRIGFVQISRKKMLKEFGGKIFSKKLKEKAVKWAKFETDMLDKYLTGQVFCYEVNGESCYGFYSVEDAIEAAEDVVDWTILHRTRQHLKQLKTWIINKVPLHARRELITI